MSIIITILIISLIIFIHEFGHFYTAKMYDMPVSEFSVGMGPLIFKKEYKGTQYSLRLIPIGGYVLIEGMSEIDKNDKEYKDFTEEEIQEYNANGFCAHPKIEKIVVLLAGVFMNFVTGFLAYLIFFLIKDFSLNSIILASKNFANIFILTFKSLIMLFTGNVNPSQLVGPLGLPSVFKTQIIQNGYTVLLPLYALLSINIGILNLLPIPALDGGRVIFVFLEYFGIKINKRVEEKIHTIGLILILLLMIYVFYNDILRILKG